MSNTELDKLTFEEAMKELEKLVKVFFDEDGFPLSRSPNDLVFDKSGVLPRFLKVFRLPTNNEVNKININRKINLKPKGDNPIFLRLTQEDGTLAWTSPIYVYR